MTIEINQKNISNIHNSNFGAKAENKEATETSEFFADTLSSVLDANGQEVEETALELLGLDAEDSTDNLPNLLATNDFISVANIKVNNDDSDNQTLTAEYLNNNAIINEQQSLNMPDEGANISKSQTSNPEIVNQGQKIYQDSEFASLVHEHDDGGVSNEQQDVDQIDSLSSSDDISLDQLNEENNHTGNHEHKESDSSAEHQDKHSHNVTKIDDKKLDLSNLRNEKNITNDQNTSSSPSLNHDVSDEVSFSFAKIASRNENNITIKMNPEKMGYVHFQIEASQEQGVSKLIVTADNKDTIAILKENIDQLQNDLKEIGFKVGNDTEFNLRDNNAGSNHHEHNAQKQQIFLHQIEALQETSAKDSIVQAMNELGITSSGINIFV